MASYNAINGTRNNINHWLLTDVLKKEWKYEGFVVSDLGGVKTMAEGHAARQITYVNAVAQSLMAGCDFSDKEFEQNIPAAQTVTFNLPVEKLAFWDEQTHGFVVNPGAFEVMVGSSSEDVRVKDRIVVVK